MPKDPLEQQISRGRQAHGRSWMAGTSLLDGIHGEHADEIHSPRVSCRPLKVRAGLTAHAQDLLGKSFSESTLSSAQPMPGGPHSRSYPDLRFYE
jgi:hypothetical protein